MSEVWLSEIKLSPKRLYLGHRMKILIGTYPLGLDFVKLFAVTESANGSIDFLPDGKGITEIKVGISAPFEEAVSTLLHEAYEKTLIDLSTRYKPKPSFSGESSDYVFFATHNQLSEAHDRVGDFLVKALPDFEKAWKKEKRDYLKKRRLAKKEKK
jgi:hypothetical protein